MTERSVGLEVQRDGRASPPAPVPDVLTQLGSAAWRAWQALGALGLSDVTRAAVLREIVDSAVVGE